jgi:hypothetical protein
MSNDFSKEEIVAFDDILEAYNDQAVLSKIIKKKRTEQTQMARADDTIRRPMPYIARSYEGSDATGNFDLATQLTVPSSINIQRHSTALMDAKELRDALQENRLGMAAAEKLASDINIACMDVASNYGSMVVPIATAATGFDDVSKCKAMMNRVGIAANERYLLLSTETNNGFASDLQKASRSFGNNKSEKAYSDAYVGKVNGFDTYEMDYANRIAAAGGGGSLTVNTLASGGQYYVPMATRTAATGQKSNVDNRFQTLTISSTTGVAAGDPFTIAGDFEVHHITKRSTGKLKTYRVVGVPSSTTMVITPPRVTAQGGSSSELQYQNVTTTGSATAAIVFLNVAAADVNPFWHGEAMEILPGRLALEGGYGVAVKRGSTDNGIELVMQKWLDGETQKYKFRWDVFFGVTPLNTEMMGILIFGQS